MRQEQYHPELLGNFADIYTGIFQDGKSYVKKVIGDKAEVYTLKQAYILVHLMNRFATIAHQIGLPVPETYGYYLTESNFGQNTVVVNQVQEYLGRDVEKIIKSDENPMSAIAGYFECFRIVATSGFQIALDVHTANFCMDQNGVVRYIDFIPPRQTLEDGRRLSVFPEPSTPLDPFFIDRIFSLEGQIPDMYTKVLRALAYNSHFRNPNTPSIVRGLLVEIFGDAFVNDMVERIEAFKQKDPVDIKDVNYIRIVAAEKFFTGGLSTDKLEYIYSLTHFSPQGSQPTTEALYEALLVSKG